MESISEKQLQTRNDFNHYYNLYEMVKLTPSVQNSAHYKNKLIVILLRFRSDQLYKEAALDNNIPHPQHLEKKDEKLPLHSSLIRSSMGSLTKLSERERKGNTERIMVFNRPVAADGNQST